MADLEHSASRFDNAVTLLNDYLTKYGENAKLKPHVYYRFARMYYKLYGGRGVRSSKYSNPDQKISFMMNYANKLSTEFPEYKSMVGELSLNMANYYKRIGDNDKALKYYEKIFKDTDPSKHHLNNAIGRAIEIYRKKGDLAKYSNLLEYSKSTHFNNWRVRRLYKKYKLNLEEIKHFGYDSRDKNAYGIQTPKSTKAYNAKKNAIDAFRAQYEQSWDSNFNKIAPLPVPGQLLRIGEDDDLYDSDRAR